MSKQFYSGNLGIAEAANEWVKLVEPPGTGEPFPALKDRDLKRSADARLESEDTTPIESGQMPRSLNREKTPDLRSHCPVCGNAYQPGQQVLALGCLSMAASAVPSARPGTECDPSGKIILGHYGCVLPRLLTLLAGFQPESRFVQASKDFAAGESVFSQHRPIEGA